MQCGGRVGKNHTLGRGVADVALMPEGDVFEGGHGVAAQDAGKPTDALGSFWVALVGIAEEPCWLAPNGSKASLSSVRWRWRSSSAILSREEPMSARVVMKWA